MNAMDVIANMIKKFFLAAGWIAERDGDTVYIHPKDKEHFKIKVTLEEPIISK
jgi:hypothetical protein